MSNRTQLPAIAVPLVLLVLAVAVRVYGIDWGLPGGHEEATPLRKAWDMWRWGLEGGPTLDPKFFNYPSLTFYVQFIVQGLLYLCMIAAGAVDSTVDYHVLYMLDKTPFFITGRLVNVLFGSATVALSYFVGKRVCGTTGAVAAAFWLAVDPLHIARSQMIEVDVPLTFFIMLSMLFLIKGIDERHKRDFLLAGITIGLATATKYRGRVAAFTDHRLHIYQKKGRP